MKLNTLALLLLTASLGCAGSKSTPAEQPTEKFQAEGGVTFHLSGGGTNANFDNNRVVGPNVNVARRPDGTWGGLLKGLAISTSKDNKHIVGTDINVTIKQENGEVIVGGTQFNSSLRVAVGREKLEVKTPRSSFSLPATAPGQYGTVGSASQVTLEGSAANVESAPQPQLAFALLATF